MSAPAIAVAWRTREPPLAIAAVAAWSERATALARRAVDRRFADGALSAVAGDGVLLLLGAADELPWVDGAVYLGRDPAAPGLLLPTLLAPSLPADLLERALRKRFAAAGPIAVVPRGAAVEVLPLGPARGVAVDDLLRWTAARPGS
jgi:hypothetical protein